MNEAQLMIRFLVPDMTEMLMKHYGWDALRSLDVLYASQTFRNICDPQCGLYYQSALYNFDTLRREIETGRPWPSN